MGEGKDEGVLFNESTVTFLVVPYKKNRASFLELPSPQGKCFMSVVLQV